MTSLSAMRYELKKVMLQKYKFLINFITKVKAFCNNFIAKHQNL